MPTPDSRPSERELLVLCEDATVAVGSLRDALAEHGVRVDFVDSLESVRGVYFDRGGHHGLAVTGGVKPQLAVDAAQSLRTLDPELRIVAFGHDLDRAALPEGVVRLRDFHPTSRAGIGALARALLR